MFPPGPFASFAPLKLFTKDYFVNLIFFKKKEIFIFLKKLVYFLLVLLWQPRIPGDPGPIPCNMNHGLNRPRDLFSLFGDHALATRSAREHNVSISGSQGGEGSPRRSRRLLSLKPAAIFSPSRTHCRPSPPSLPRTRAPTVARPFPFLA